MGVLTEALQFKLIDIFKPNRPAPSTTAPDWIKDLDIVNLAIPPIASAVVPAKFSASGNGDRAIYQHCSKRFSAIHWLAPIQIGQYC